MKTLVFKNVPDRTQYMPVDSIAVSVAFTVSIGDGGNPSPSGEARLV
jgi:hypothetical protein